MKLLTFKVLVPLVALVILTSQAGAQNRQIVCAVNSTSAPRTYKLSPQDTDAFESLKKDFNETEISEDLFLTLKALVGEASKIAIDPRTDDPQRIMILRRRIANTMTYSENVKIQKMKPALDSFMRETANLSEAESQVQIELRNLISFYKLSIAELSAKLDGLPCKMTPNQVFAIYVYTGGAYSVLNPALRLSVVDPKYTAIVANINSGLSMLGNYRGQVMRGGGLPPSAIAAHQPGKIVVYDAFTSASISRPFTGQFSFIIKSKFGKYIGPISIQPEEEEVLFKSGSSFFIKRIEGKDLEMEER